MQYDTIQYSAVQTIVYYNIGQYRFNAKRNMFYLNQSFLPTPIPPLISVHVFSLIDDFFTILIVFDRMTTNLYALRVLVLIDEQSSVRQLNQIGAGQVNQTEGQQPRKEMQQIRRKNYLEGLSGGCRHIYYSDFCASLHALQTNPAAR